jgi:hypothetical protein
MKACAANQQRRLQVGQVVNLRPIGNRPFQATTKASERRKRFLPRAYIFFNA